MRRITEFASNIGTKIHCSDDPQIWNVSLIQEITRKLDYVNQNQEGPNGLSHSCFFGTSFIGLVAGAFAAAGVGFITELGFSAFVSQLSHESQEVFWPEAAGSLFVVVEAEVFVAFAEAADKSADVE